MKFFCIFFLFFIMFYAPSKHHATIIFQSRSFNKNTFFVFFYSSEHPIGKQSTGKNTFFFFFIKSVKKSYPTNMSTILAAIWDRRDLRVEDWSFMSSPLPTVLLCSLYFYIVKIWGPQFMKDRKPFELKNTLIVYNLVQVNDCFYSFNSQPFSNLQNEIISNFQHVFVPKICQLNFFRP